MSKKRSSRKRQEPVPGQVPQPESPPAPQQAHPYGGAYPPHQYGAYPGYGSYGNVYYGGDIWATRDSVDIKLILSTLWRKRITVMAAACLALVAALCYLARATRIYEAESRIELSLRRPRIMSQKDAVIEDGGRGRASAAEAFNTQLLKLGARNLRMSAASNLVKRVNDRSMLDMAGARRLVRSVKIELVKKSSLVSLRAQSADPSLAAMAANAYADTARENAFAVNRELSENAVEWLAAQAALQRKTLQAAEQELLRFREVNQVDSLEAQRRTAEQALLAYNDELVRLQSTSVQTRDILDLLDSLSLNQENAGKLPSSVPRAQEITLRLEELTTAVAARDSLLARYTEKHPEVAVQDRKIEAATRQLEKEIGRARDNTRSNLSLLENQARSIEKKKAEQQRLGAELERKIARCQSQLKELSRERDASELSYNSLLHRMEEARLSSDENTATISLAMPAQTPSKPVSPRVGNILFIALFVGLGGGIGLALLTSMLEDRIWNAADVENSVGLRVLGVIPLADTDDRRSVALASDNSKYPVIAESFAGIRGVLDSANAGKTFLVTSSAPSEGKTVTSVNLATASAKSGMKTLLVDLDLRRPRLHRICNAPTFSSHGLIEAFQSTDPLDFDQLPVQTDIANLEMVSNFAPTDSSPADALGSQRVREFVEWASTRYDRVIVDSPPVGVASDSMVLGGLVDAVVLVCRFNQSRKNAVKFAVRRLNDCHANILGIVINGLKAPKPGSVGSYLSGNYTYHYSSYSSPRSEPFTGQTPQKPRNDS